MGIPPRALLALGLVAGSVDVAAATTCTAAVLHNVESGRCLYHTGIDAGTSHTWGCWQDPNMLIEQDPAGLYVRLRSKWTNQCYYVHTDSKVYTWTCWNDNNLRWQKVAVPGSTTKHRYRHVTRNRCLEVAAGGQVVASPCNNANPRQVFSWRMYEQTGWAPPHSPMAQYYRDEPANPPCNPFVPNLPSRPYVLPYHAREGCPDDGITFGNLRPWHDPASWGGAGVPAADGTDVNLPVGVNMLIEQCSLEPSVYGRVHVPAGSRLIFADTAIFMKTRGVLVNGELWIGSETCRVYSPVHIEFHGQRSEHDGACWRKGLCVSDTGTLEMHGKQYVQTWTRLAKTAEPGDDVIYLQDRVNWDKGQEVVVVTSYFNDTAHLSPADLASTNTNEVRRIENVWHRTVRLTEALDHRHHGGSSYQVEVGLLSRNIVLRGDGSSEGEQYGGHVLSSGAMRVEGVQAYRMGQQNMMARYPFHFHLAGVRPSNYVRECSIQKSFYRCVTIHGVWETTVTRNVCFDVSGHGYYIEDGVEEQNTISYNLAAHVHVIGGRAAKGAGQTGEKFDERPDLRQPADASASGFYISNAQNRVYGNAASGGWSGFAFPKLPSPIGAYAPVGGSFPPELLLPQDIYLSDFHPDERPVLEFDGNTAHSTAYFWGDAGAIYIGGELTTKSSGELRYDSGRSHREPRICTGPMCDSSNEKTVNKYTNIKVALCDKGFAHWGKRVEVHNYEMYDGGLYGTILADAVVAHGIKARTENYHPSRYAARRDKPHQAPQLRGFEAYDQEAKTILHDIDFRDMRTSGYSVNGDRRWWHDACALSGLTGVDRTKPDGIFGISHIRYTNHTYQNHFCINTDDNSGTRYYNFIDFDGYATNRPQWGSTFGGAALQNKYDQSNWWQAEAACELEPEWHLWVCPRREHSRIASLMVMVQANSFMRLGSFNYEDEAGNYSHVKDWTNEHVGIYAGKTFLWGNDNSNQPSGNAWARWAYMTRNANGVVGPSNMGWLVHFDDGTPDNVQLFSRAMPIDSWVIVALEYPPGTAFSIRSNHSWWDPAGGQNHWAAGCPNPSGTCTLYEPVGAFEALRDSDPTPGGALGQDFTDYYYWDDAKGHLYLKMRSWAKPQDEFAGPGGASLWHHQAWRRGVIIEATCPVMEPAVPQQNFGNVKWNQCAYPDGSGQMWTWTCWNDPAFLFHQDIVRSATSTSAQTGVGPYPRHEHEYEIVRLRNHASGKCIHPTSNPTSSDVYSSPCSDNLLFRWTRYLEKRSNNYDAVYKHVVTGKCLTMQPVSANQGKLKVAPCPSAGSALDAGDSFPVDNAFLFRCKRDIDLVPRCQKRSVDIPANELDWASNPYVPRPDYYWASDGPYSGCSVGCGGGVNCRTVVCRLQGPGTMVAASHCDGLDKLEKDDRTCLSCNTGGCPGTACCSSSSCEGACVGCVPAHWGWSYGIWPTHFPHVDGTCHCAVSSDCPDAPYEVCSAGACVAGPTVGEACIAGVCGEGLQCNAACNRCVSATGDLPANQFCLADSECKSNTCSGVSGCTPGACTYPFLTPTATVGCSGSLVVEKGLVVKSVQKVATDLEPLLHAAFEQHHRLGQKEATAQTDSAETDVSMKKRAPGGKTSQLTERKSEALAETEKASAHGDSTQEDEQEQEQQHQQPPQQKQEQEEQQRQEQEQEEEQEQHEQEQEQEQEPTNKPATGDMHHSKEQSSEALPQQQHQQPPQQEQEQEQEKQQKQEQEQEEEQEQHEQEQDQEHEPTKKPAAGDTHHLKEQSSEALADAPGPLQEQFAGEVAALAAGSLHAARDADPAMYSTECVNRVGKTVQQILVAGMNRLECTVQLLDDKDRLGSLLVTMDYQVKDTRRPTIECPPNQYHEAARGSTTTVVDLRAPHVHDDGDTAPQVINDAPEESHFPNGRRTTVVWTAIDAAGHTARCSHTVTVAECTMDDETQQKVCSHKPDLDDLAVIPSEDPFRRPATEVNAANEEPIAGGEGTGEKPAKLPPSDSPGPKALRR